ncbi:MAG: hypothetical protein IPJ51_12715 [Saprospiraceae bacterium]|nr:hypothetical protein [Saprospiraceae bacterium]
MPFEYGNGYIDSSNATASICDNNGELLFSTDGVKVFLPDGQDIPFNTIFSNKSQAILLLPILDCNNEYAIITIDRHPEITYNFDELAINEPEIPINSKLNLTIFNLTNRTFQQIQQFGSRNGFVFCEKLAVTLIGNSYNIITLSRKITNQSTDHITLASVYKMECKDFLHYNDFEIPNVSCNPFGQIKISPDNTKIVFANWNFANSVLLDMIISNNQIQSINYFDRINIAPYPSLPLISQVNKHFGVEFSENSNFLYISIVGSAYHEWNNSHSFIYQINLFNSTFTNNLIHTHAQSEEQLMNFYGIGHLQYNYGNIYFTLPTLNKLGIIKDINTLHPLVDENYLELTNITYYGLPPLTPYIDSNIPFIQPFNSVMEIIGEETNSQISHDTCECNECKEEKLQQPKLCVKAYINTDNNQITQNGCHQLILEVCNFYPYLDFCDVVIDLIEITNPLGETISHSFNSEIQIFPKGAACFGDIHNCSCVKREFLIKSNNAISGVYKIEIRSISYKVKYMTSQSINLNVN